MILLSACCPRSQDQLDTHSASTHNHASTTAMRSFQQKVLVFPQQTLMQRSLHFVCPALGFSTLTMHDSFKVILTQPAHVVAHADASNG